MFRSRAARGVLSAAIAAVVLIGMAGSAPAQRTGRHGDRGGIHKIRHIVIIIQENRSFDSYFGTYPGAVGIPMHNGTPSECSPDPATGACIAPYVDHADRNGGGPHDSANSGPDIAGGKMNGFVAQALRGRHHCADPTNPACVHSASPDVMGYHVQSDIPNYWAYARNYVLQDHLFESVHSWSFPSHLYFVSGWSANCATANPMSCHSSVDPKNRSLANPTPFSWTDITYLLHRHHVSWAWYLDHGAAPSLHLFRHRGTLAETFVPGVPKIWNVMPGFVDVHQDRQTGNVQNEGDFFRHARAGTLPAVSWLLPDGPDSEHPPALVSTGESYVTRLVDAVMSSKDWKSSAIFITWDDWGGFYDNVVPPQVDALGYGIRVPGLVISPYAKAGYVDHQTLSFDSYLRFIENDFLGGQSLNPKTDGRPDPRPDVRETQKLLGSLVKDFNFRQRPRPPVLLAPCPKTTLTGVPSPAPNCSLPPGVRG